MRTTGDHATFLLPPKFNSCMISSRVTRQYAKTKLACAQTNGEDGRSKRPKAILSIRTKGEENGLSRKGDILHLIVSTVKDVNILKKCIIII